MAAYKRMLYRCLTPEGRERIRAEQRERYRKSLRGRKLTRPIARGRRVVGDLLAIRESTC